MIEIVKEIQQRIMIVGLAGYGICFFALAVIFAFAVNRENERNFRKASWFNKIAMLFFLAVGIAVGGSKPVIGYFNFASGLKDDGSSIYTNDVVHISWVKTGIPYVPNTATVYIDYKERNSTNDWMELGECSVTQYHVEYYVRNATNFMYNIWWYNDSEDVHTNGVWVFTTSTSKRNNPQESNQLEVIPAHSEVAGDGKIISTPSKKGQDCNATR